MRVGDLGMEGGGGRGGFRREGGEALGGREGRL